MASRLFIVDLKENKALVNHIILAKFLQNNALGEPKKVSPHSVCAHKYSPIPIVGLLHILSGRTPSERFIEYLQQAKNTPAHFPVPT